MRRWSIRCRATSPITALPVGQAPGTFQVSAEPDDGRIWLDEANYQHYDHVVSAVHAVSAERLVGIFHHMRPLLERAYGELGYRRTTSTMRSLPRSTICWKRQSLTLPLSWSTRPSPSNMPTKAAENLPAAHRQLLRMGRTTRDPDKLREIAGSGRLLDQ